MLRGDKDNDEKAIIDGIFGGKNSKLGNDKKVIDGRTTIIATHGDERVEVWLRPVELEIGE